MSKKYQPNKNRAPNQSFDHPLKLRDDTTPMVAQFIEIKNNNPGFLLFYRMGEFYELFFDDAIIASQALDIVLTQRGKYGDRDIPMCGVPVIRAQEYLLKLTDSGFRVAICEQVEDPKEAKKRGPKAVVKREVVRLVTHGTITEDELLDYRAHCFLASIHWKKAGSQAALAVCDLSTGEFFAFDTNSDNLSSDLSRIEPKELLYDEALAENELFLEKIKRHNLTTTSCNTKSYKNKYAKERIAEFYEIATIDGIANFSNSEIMAISSLLDYIEFTQIGQKPNLQMVKKHYQDNILHIDRATRANLELTRNSHGEYRGSLLSCIDKTITGAGGRELNYRIMNPITDIDEINKRLDSVEFFSNNLDFCDKLRDILKTYTDVSRSLSRIHLNRANPPDLLTIQNGLYAAIHILQEYEKLPYKLPLLGEAGFAFKFIKKADFSLLTSLSDALNTEQPTYLKDGGIVKEGYNAKLDELRLLRTHSHKAIMALQTKYIEKTIIKALKIKHNNILGYHIDVPSQYAQKLMSEPLNADFIHRQTLANTTRFTTIELNETEMKINQADERSQEIEVEIFNKLCALIIENSEMLNRLSQAIALLDVSASMAILADLERYSRPKLNNSKDFEIIDGRHPVVEQALSKTSQNFCENDCQVTTESLDDGKIWLLTGPNMAGKSTFLRQNAIIIIMAQMGAYIPAKSAVIGIVDKLFSRVGASDDLASGRSTFMVEMVETAAILNQASSRSFVILDEIGRGTATFDGLSIAWATLERLHNHNISRVIFATHYHELTMLANKLKNLENVTMKVKEWRGEVIFMHEVIKGSANRSYGIQVAKLAGLPKEVTRRANQILLTLEANNQTKIDLSPMDELPLFSNISSCDDSDIISNSSQSVINSDNQTRDLNNEIQLSVDEYDELSEISKNYKKLAKILEAKDPDELTPIKALELLYELKGELKQK